MGKKKWIDKKHATTFTLVHRPQNDPLIHDESASAMVFKPMGPGNEKSLSQPSSSSNPGDKVKTAQALAEELGPEIVSKVRSNEGEAAQWGINYDDTEYDYMQHLRDLGTTTEAVFVEAPHAASKQRGKNKPKKLEDALREVQAPEDLLPKGLLPNDKLTNRTYQNQQNIPDELAGFQPDMDPRLREVLEALEDEEYVDDDEELFGEILTEREEVHLDEFLEQTDEFDVYGDRQSDEDEDGWATDDTEKPTKPQSKSVSFSSTSTSSAPEDPHAPTPPPTADWMSEFSKFKRAQKSSLKPSDNELASSIGDLSSLGGLSMVYSVGGSKNRRRRKKAAAESVYSMSSSVLPRTEGQTLLDQRFDKIEALYSPSDSDGEDYDHDESLSITSKSSHRPAPPQGFKESRPDFNAIMDDFLESYSVAGKYGQRVKRGKQQTGLEQLDEIRKGLGRARISERR